MFRVVGVVGLSAALFFAVRLRESPDRSVPPAVTRAAALADDLQEAMAAQGSRPFEPRLTGGFEYRPVETTRGASGWRPGPEVAIATASVAKELATDDSSAARRLRGTAALLAGDADGAIRELENVTGGPGEAAEVLADLSAAYYVRGSLHRDHADFVRALAFASRSTEQRPELPEAWFNRALAAEAAGVAADATASWTRYLALDPTSQWSEEARRHLRAIGG